MARRAQGWKLRIPTGSKSYSVRFWSQTEHRQIEFGTGESDARRAAKRAAELYSEAVRRKRFPQRRRPCVGAPLSTLGLGTEWIRTRRGLLDDATLTQYAIILGSHLAPAFPSLLDVDAASVRAYQATRLSEVQVGSLRHELAVLRGILRWAHEKGHLADEVYVPPPPRGATGTRWTVRRCRAKPDELSPSEIAALIAALPERGPRLGPVRSRFELQYELGLRPATLDRLSVPEHWHPGSDYLTITADVMKGRKPSRKRLTRLAKEILERVAPKRGLIFGVHEYRKYIAAAASVALEPAKAAKFAAAHLRSSAITHFLDRGAPLTAAQRFADHLRATTTDKYVRASERALEAELARQGKL